MKKLTLSLCFGLLCLITVPVTAQMTNGGTFEFTSSSTFMPLLNKKTGVIKGVRSQFLHTLVNEGTTYLDRCSMNKEVTNFGVLAAQATRFYDNLIVYSGDVTLSSCTLENLYIMDANVTETENGLTVILQGATTINGSIIFETGLGKVSKSADVIIKGEISGGVVLD